MIAKDEPHAGKNDHPSPSAFAHAVLRTTTDNYAAMTRWYINLLNATIAFEVPYFMLLRYDEEHHRIAITAKPEHVPKPKDQRIAEVDHLAYTYSTLTELAQVYTSLKAKAMLPIWTVNHGPTTSFYYRDPDGNKVELQVDNLDTTEEADEFVRGPKFAMNPMGTDIDAESWAEEILAKVRPDGKEGLTADEVRRLKTRKEIGERFTTPAIF
ncbi:hypothetical protein RBB50_010917 [Rhinocladiella similis]